MVLSKTTIIIDQSTQIAGQLGISPENLFVQDLGSEELVECIIV